MRPHFYYVILFYWHEVYFLIIQIKNNFFIYKKMKGKIVNKVDVKIYDIYLTENQA